MSQECVDGEGLDWDERDFSRTTKTLYPLSS
jgi:hypothetical protein